VFVFDPYKKPETYDDGIGKPNE